MALMSFVRFSVMMSASASPISAAATTIRKMTKFMPTACCGATNDRERHEVEVHGVEDQLDADDDAQRARR